MSLEKWNDIQLGDHIDILTDYHANGAYEKLKENIILKYEPDYAIMVRTLNFEAGDFDNNLIYINKEEYNYLSKSKVYPNDIVMNKIANAGSVYIMPDLNQPVSLAMNLFLIRFKKTLDQRFMYYLMKIYEPYIKQYANGTATLTITKDSVRNLQFKVPELSTQKKIAKILSNYDDLIENNLKQIKLLEEKARLTYEEWFLRFRIDGQKLEIDEETELPFGWEKKNLFDIADVRYGYPFKAEQFNNEANGTPIIRIRNIPSSSTSDYTTEIVDEKYLVKKGDLLIGMDGEFHINHWSGEEGYLVQRVCSIKTKESNLFGYFSEAIKPKIKYYEETISGATVAHLGKKHLEKIEIVVPTNDITQKLEIFNSLLKQKINLATQNNLLKESRNILLPRLMTGIIDVDKLDIEV